MAKYEMTPEKRKYLIRIMHWYWQSMDNGEPYIHNSEFEFVYQLWKNGLGFYGSEIQERLNKIVNIYNQNKGKWKEEMKNG